MFKTKKYKIFVQFDEIGERGNPPIADVVNILTKLNLFTHKVEINNLYFGGNPIHHVKFFTHGHRTSYDHSRRRYEEFYIFVDFDLTYRWYGGDTDPNDFDDGLIPGPTWDLEGEFVDDIKYAEMYSAYSEDEHVSPPKTQCAMKSIIKKEGK